MDQETKQAFDLILAKLDGVAGELKGVQGELKEVNNRLDKIESTQESMLNRQTDHTKRIDAVYGAVWHLYDLLDTKADKIAQ